MTEAACHACDNLGIAERSQRVAGRGSSAPSKTQKTTPPSASNTAVSPFKGVGRAILIAPSVVIAGRLVDW